MNSRAILDSTECPTCGASFGERCHREVVVHPGGKFAVLDGMTVEFYTRYIHVARGNSYLAVESPLTDKRQCEMEL